MIKIKTTMPKAPVTPELRKQMAEKLARYFQDYVFHKDSVPYPIDESGGYVLDGHNDWYCKMDDDDNQIVQIWCRYPERWATRLFSLTSWICETKGWQILPAYAGSVKAAKIGVEFELSVRKSLTPDQLSSITFEIPIEQMVVFVDGAIDRSARVIGYTTDQYAD